MIHWLHALYLTKDLSNAEQAHCLLQVAMRDTNVAALTRRMPAVDSYPTLPYQTGFTSRILYEPP